MAAKEKSPPMYAEIHNLDLIAKEYKYHRFCYSTFTCYATESTSSSSKLNCVRVFRNGITVIRIHRLPACQNVCINKYSSVEATSGRYESLAELVWWKARSSI